MSVDLIKLITLITGFLLYGKPDGYDHAFALRFTFQPGANTGAIEIAYDPVAIFYRHVRINDLKGHPAGGYAAWSYVVIDSRLTPEQQRHVLEHELIHAWQMRTFGLLMPLTFALDPWIWEPQPYVIGNFDMPQPRSLNWSLLRLWIPLEPPR